MSDDFMIPPPPRLPRLRVAPPPPPTPKPQPDEHHVGDALRDLGRRVTSLEDRFGKIAARSVATIVAADVLVGLGKYVLDWFLR